MKVLIISAHPDDEILGLGGTIAKHVEVGDYVTVLMVTEGASSQYLNQPEIIDQKKKEMENVRGILGYDKLDFLDFPDMRLDALNKVELNTALSNYININKPNVVYTHFFGDINNDHKEVFEATMVACRPSKSSTVKKILCYHTPSSTEWSFQNSVNTFMPNLYIDITSYLDLKLTAMKEYKSELREYPHPRSLEALDTNAKYWGKHIGVHAAEPFMIIREIN